MAVGKNANRRVAAQDTIRRYGLRTDGQDAPSPPRTSKGGASTEERVDRGDLSPHEAAQEPVLVRAPTLPLFASEDQIFDLRRCGQIRIFGDAFVVR